MAGCLGRDEANGERGRSLRREDERRECCWMAWAKASPKLVVVVVVVISLAGVKALEHNLGLGFVAPPDDLGGTCLTELHLLDDSVTLGGGCFAFALVGRNNRCIVVVVGASVVHLSVGGSGFGSLTRTTGPLSSKIGQSHFCGQLPGPRRHPGNRIRTERQESRRWSGWNVRNRGVRLREGEGRTESGKGTRSTSGVVSDHGRDKIGLRRGRSSAGDVRGCQDGSTS
ncbi:hypothetical protein CVT26_000665 [Gymnopilus dilepis]|uniref:Uncharacterized protein n=1 Tax=Gymnopilus dilepis TaxID=231916 RepID=A0A409WEF9_9AGAR|nr:hypothetical protein CVT26_000665 [Gymnopilus dilepis]